MTKTVTKAVTTILSEARENSVDRCGKPVNPALREQALQTVYRARLLQSWAGNTAEYTATIPRETLRFETDQLPPVSR